MECKKSIVPFAILLASLFNVNSAIKCYDCYYRANEGDDVSMCLNVVPGDGGTKLSDCTDDKTFEGLNACLETISMIDGVFAMHRGCTVWGDLYCGRNNDLHGIYCCQGEDGCNSAGPDDIGGGAHASASSVRLAYMSVLVTVAACLYFLQ